MPILAATESYLQAIYTLSHKFASCHISYVASCSCMVGPLQVLTEIAGETLEQMAAAPKNKAPSRVVAAPEEEEEEDTEAADLQARLNAIRS